LTHSAHANRMNEWMNEWMNEYKAKKFFFYF
jgi:hypothetical protein